MRYVFSITIGILVCISTVPAQRMESYGLEGITVTSLARSSVHPTFGSGQGTFLIAGTDSFGIFIRDLSTDDSYWISLGLEGKRITSVYSYYWEIGPARYTTLFAGVEPNITVGDSTVLYRYTQDGYWIPSENGINYSSTLNIASICGISSLAHAPPQPLFAGGHTCIYRSWNIGENWEKVFEFLSSPLVLTVHQKSGEVWAGGGWEGTAFLPWIIKSPDQGNSWKEMNFDDYPYNAVHSFAIHPEHPDTVFAGLDRGILKTVDGGSTWAYTELNDESIHLKGLAIDPYNPDHLWVGGSLKGLLRMWESFDNGIQWISIDPEVTSSVPGISNFVADPYRQGVVYVSSLGAGVWRYENTEQQTANYFPLQKGNRWTFSDAQSESIIDTMRIDDHLYYVFDNFRHYPDVSLRMTDDDKLLLHDKAGEQIWLDFSAAVGDTWIVTEPGGDLKWKVHLQSKTDTIAVHAGTFTNCYRFWFDFGCCDNDWVEWYAPNIGPVKRILYGFAVIEYPLSSVVLNGEEFPTLVTNQPKVCVPEQVYLYPNYPNPFNAMTTIRFNLYTAGSISMEIYNIMGKKVRTLVADYKPAGSHHVVWDGMDNSGKEVSSGTYFIQLSNGARVTVNKVAFIRRRFY